MFTSSPELKSLFDVESVKINYTDYDQFLKLNRSKDEDICVFLDSAITHHPDYYLFGSKCASNPNVYYNEINRIFAFIEKKFNLKVIIAGHPKSRYIGNEFCGRDIIVGDTLRLVSQSKLVLTHASLSINYAIYMYKKIIILTTGSYGKYIPDNESMLTLMESLNRELGIQLIDIMEKKYKIKNKSVCIDSYNIYKYKYSCWRAIENMDSEEIVTRYIKRL